MPRRNIYCKIARKTLLSSVLYDKGEPMQPLTPGIYRFG